MQPHKKLVLRMGGKKTGFCVNTYRKSDDFWKKPGFLRKP